ncbi:MAG: S1C family serine protease [Patescibacteria group bacterium]
MPFKPSNAFLLIILAMFFGALSGILAVIIVGAGNLKFPFIGQINYANPDLDNRIVIEQPRSVVVQQDTQIHRVENDLLPAVVNIYQKKSSPDPLIAAYTDHEVLGRGFVLTADGWIVSTKGAISNLKGNFSAVGYQNKKYVLAGLLEDKATGLVFAKTTSADLPVAPLGKSADLQLGQTVIIVAGRDELLVSQITKIGYDFLQSRDLVLNSDYPEKRIYFSDDLAADYEGAVAVNFKGEVIGVVSGGSAIPVDYFSNVINDVLKSQKIARASLGLDYLDLSQVDNLIEIADKGAYVAYEPLKGSAAYGLVKKGDLIKKINDYELNAYQGLADVLNKFSAGQRIELTVRRAGQDLSVAAVLK